MAAGTNTGRTWAGSPGPRGPRGAQRAWCAYGLRQPQDDGDRAGHQRQVHDERQVQRESRTGRAAPRAAAAAEPAHVGGRRHERGARCAAAGARSITYAVAAPVNSPADRPEEQPAAYSQPSAEAPRKQAALAAAKPRPHSSTGRLPTVSDTLPASRRTPMTPKAYTAYTTVTISSEKPNLSWCGRRPGSAAWCPPCRRRKHRPGEQTRAPSAVVTVHGTDRDGASGPARGRGAGHVSRAVLAVPLVGVVQMGQMARAQLQPDVPCLAARLRPAARHQLAGLLLRLHHRAGAAQRLARRLVQEERGDHPDHPGDHQVVRRDHLVAGLLHQRRGDQRGRAAEEGHGDVEGDRQRAVAQTGGEQRGQGGRGGAGEAHQQQTEDQAAERGQQDPALPDQQERGSASTTIAMLPTMNSGRRPQRSEERPTAVMVRATTHHRAEDQQLGGRGRPGRGSRS